MSAVDALQGFHAIKLTKRAQPKTAFVTHKGQFEFKVMPFGLCGAPPTYQAAMNLILSGLTWDICAPYVDDVIIWSKDYETHKKDLAKVLERFIQHNMKLKSDKCVFCRIELEYLGHDITTKGIKCSQKKIDAIQSFPVPTKVREIRQILGMTGYYRRFIKDYAKITRPLQLLTKKGAQLKWTPECQSAFDTLKMEMTNPPILQFPDYSKDFRLYTDASKDAIACVLSQKDENNQDRVICYAGRALKDREMRHHISEQEHMAVVYGLSYFKHYLYNSKVTVITDCSALQYLKTAPLRGRIARWALILSSFDYNVVFRKGSLNHVDALSRREYQPYREELENQAFTDQPNLPFLGAIIGRLNDQINTNSENEPLTARADVYNALQPQAANENSLIDQHKLAEEQYLDPAYTDIIDYLEIDYLPSENSQAQTTMVNSEFYYLGSLAGVLYRIPKLNSRKSDTPVQLAVPRSRVQEILKGYHDSIESMHPGVTRTFHKIREKYFWPSMFQDIKEYVASCNECATYKHPPGYRRYKMKPREASYPWENLHIDLIGPLPRTRKGNLHIYIYLMVDGFTKYLCARAIPSKHAEQCADAMYDEVYMKHAPAANVISDNAKNFTARIFNRLTKLFDQKQEFTSAFWPRGNGEAERYVKEVGKCLALYVNSRATDWDELLSSAVYALNCTPKSDTTGYSPYQAIFGSPPRLIVDDKFLHFNVESYKSVDDYTEKLSERLQVIREIIKDNNDVAREHMTKHYDKKTKERKFRVGEHVWRLNPHVPTGIPKKFVHMWQGPYVVHQKRGEANYILRGLDGKLMVASVNVAHMKPYIHRSLRPHLDPNSEQLVWTGDVDSSEETNDVDDEQNDIPSDNPENQDSDTETVPGTSHEHTEPEIVAQNDPEIPQEQQVAPKKKQSRRSKSCPSKAKTKPAPFTNAQDDTARPKRKAAIDAKVKISTMT